ncbi:hypothetical protein MPDQ_006847 [Monascus purpureus]|uniref:Uncharacterized protein n=1 Tax=Monascus purpureus TaxID=5098 RepID=A0A507QVQ0_MONPU|nr:hypothetical protein MPDQ_006847 [Monascus purpureus]BDD59912.1 hypothetical protein MAP00_005084 [Monascus purpureus]
MLLLPLIGAFYIALLGAVLPVPGVMYPSESYLRRLSGIMRAMTLTKGVFEVMELIGIYYIEPEYAAPKTERTYLWSREPFEPLAEIDAPEMFIWPLVFNHQLWEDVWEKGWEDAWDDTDEAPYMDLVPVDPDPPTSISPPWPFDAVSVMAVVFLASLWFLYKRDTHTPGDLSEDPPEEPSCLVDDEAPSLFEEVVALIESSTSLPHSGGPDPLTLPEGSGIAGEPGFNYAIDELKNSTQDTSDVMGPSIHVQTPEIPASSAGPPVVGDSRNDPPAEQSNESRAETVSNPVSHSRRSRPSRAKRFRRRGRALRDLQGEASAVIARPASAVHPESSVPPVPPEGPGRAVAYYQVVYYDPVYGYYSGPSLVPVYVQYMHQPLPGWQYIPPLPPFVFYQY